MKNLQKSDLLDLGMIIASDNAPVRKRFYYDSNNELRMVITRLGNAWSKKECTDKCNSIYRNARSGELKSKLPADADYGTRVNLLVAIAASEYDKATLQEYAPVILKSM